MNERYLFKGKRADNGRWVQGYYVFDTHDSQPRIIVEREYSTGTHYSAIALRVIPETVGQCTGLKDKNGKLIFEGDILKLANFRACLCKSCKPQDYIFAVTHDGFNFTTTKCECNSGHHKGSLFWFDSKHRLESTEMIGNRWDNPELLEG